MNYKLTKEERETRISFLEIENKWFADTTVQKDMKRFQEQGWFVTGIQHYSDGSVMSMQFEAPRSSITIGKAVRRKRTMSEEQRQAAAKRLCLARQKKKKY